MQKAKTKQSEPQELTNKQRFLALESEWATVRIGYIRELTPQAKAEIENIFRTEFNTTWFPNRFCKACYYDAVKQLIEHYQL